MVSAGQAPGVLHEKQAAQGTVRLFWKIDFSCECRGFGGFDGLWGVGFVGFVGLGRGSLSVTCSLQGTEGLRRGIC